MVALGIPVISSCFSGGNWNRLIPLFFQEFFGLLRKVSIFLIAIFPLES